ncbi:MAG TPA: S1C family serine protease [Vicinamibacteria bacterium]|nr:S1C family serine protease [Vicinamibacteria bacterium]
MSLASLNEDIRSVVRKAADSVVEVRARRGAPSSGVAWPGDGLLLTALHTVEDEEGIEIRTGSGESYPAEIAGRDPSTGIALLRAKNASFAIPSWGDTAKLEAGELLILVAASSSGRRVSLTTASVVTGEWTTDQGGRIHRYLETDSRLFPGFSGSVLLSADGRALALNTAGLRRRAPLAIPVETLRPVVEKLLKHGDVRRGFLGITTYPIRLPDSVKSQQTGLLVLSVQEGSPAAKAGLYLGDVLLGIDGRRVDSPAALLSLLGEERIGKTLEARILRTGKEETVSVSVGSRS